MLSQNYNTVKKKATSVNSLQEEEINVKLTNSQEYKRRNNVLSCNSTRSQKNIDS